MKPVVRRQTDTSLSTTQIIFKKVKESDYFFKYLNLPAPEAAHQWVGEHDERPPPRPEELHNTDTAIYIKMSKAYNYIYTT
jgi:hypothetical protein